MVALIAPPAAPGVAAPMPGVPGVVAGITGAERGAEDGPTPAEFPARTPEPDDVPLTSRVMVPVRAVPVKAPVFAGLVGPPARVTRHSTSYPVIARPPSFAGAAHDSATWVFP